MLHFNRLDYYAVPTLPSGWEAPTWLTLELGIFAGRLYFEYEEYDDLCQYLGSQEASKKPERNSEGTLSTVELSTTEEVAAPRALTGQSFTSKPLTFLQQWLSLKRKGQDFVHTPMGYVCQGKSLAASHPFFSRLEEDKKGELTNADNSAGEVDTQEYLED